MTCDLEREVLKSKVEYKLTWRWYRKLGKDDSLGTYPAINKFPTYEALKAFIPTIPLPANGMQLKYKIERVTTELLEDDKNG